MPFSSKEVNSSLFRQIFESGIIGLFFCKFDGSVIVANDAFLGFTKFTTQDLKDGKLNWKKLTPPEFADITDVAIKNLRTKGSNTPYEKEYFRKDGSRVQLLMGSVYVPTKHYDFMTYALDISERSKVEKELSLTLDQLESRVDERTKDLQEANLFLQSLFENIPNMIFVKDAKDLKFIRFNKAGEDLLGIRREQLIGKSDRDFFPPDEAEVFIQTDRNVLDKKFVLDIPEESITTSDGQKILHTKKIPLLDENGESKFLLGISEDITEIKRSEQERNQLIRTQIAKEEAEKNVERLELLADASTLLTSSLDYQSTLKNFYDFLTTRMADWCHITIFKPSENETPQFVFETSELSQEIISELKLHRWKLIKDIDEALNINSEESELLNNLKGYNFKSIIYVALKARGNTLGYMLLANKQTSSRLFGLTDLQLAEELADKASLAIDNSRLFSEAQEANKLKDEFLATLSHELRTPLNIIHGYSELLLNFSDKMSEKEKIESLDAIYRNTLDQTNIVNDILDVSKIITGKMSLNLSLLSTSSIISSVAKNSAQMAKAKNLKLTTDLPAEPLFVNMDKTRFQQIIWNLVSNAIKFTPEGGQVSIKNYKEDNCSVIEVKDTGIGVNPKFIPYIFERFRQEDGSMTRKYGGLGLGLAIVRHLVEMHGGTVEAKSDGKSKGSQFFVRVPLATSNSKSKEFKSPNQSNSSLENIKVLLVEDSRDNRLLITRLLTSSGALIKEASSAEEARKVLKSYKPDIILCDIGMEKEDGTQFIMKLRASKNETPAIALTAYARDEEREQFLKAGFQEHVTKPISVQTLITAIKKVI